VAKGYGRDWGGGLVEWRAIQPTPLRLSITWSLRQTARWPAHLQRFRTAITSFKKQRILLSATVGSVGGNRASPVGKARSLHWLTSYCMIMPWGSQPVRLSQSARPQFTCQTAPLYVSVCSIHYNWLLAQYLSYSCGTNFIHQIASSPQATTTLFTEPPSNASKLSFIPNHFLAKCFRFLVLYTVYNGLEVLYLGHSKLQCNASALCKSYSNEQAAE